MSSHSVPTAPATREGDSRGTVAAPHESSVRAGLEMFDRGGNAVDAAVAAALVAGVVEPAETTLAGSGFLLLNDPSDGPWSVEFGPRAPKRAHDTMFEIDRGSEDYPVNGVAAVVGRANSDGPLAPGVPRTLLGLLTAHQRWGALPREVVLGPAIAAAADGFGIDPFFLTSALADLRRLRLDDQARKTFLDPDGLPLGHESGIHAGLGYGPAAPLPQPLLAETLGQLAAAPDLESLRTGAIARKLAETSRELGGILTVEDFRESTPAVVRPLSLRFRDHDVHVPTGPSGGVTELQALAIWQQLHPDRTGDASTPERTRQLALVLRHAFADRYHWLGDPDSVPVPRSDVLLGSAYSRHLAEQIRRDVAPDDEGQAPWSTFAWRAQNDPWAFTGERAPRWTPAGASTPTAGTTHVSAVDAAGRAVSITHTAANPFGSAVVCPRTGLLFDAAMAWFNAAPGAANSIRPGGRPLANMGPALLTASGRSVAALGASGGRRIISAVVQILIDLVDRRMSVDEALQAPRMDASGPELLLQEGLSSHAGALEGLNPVVVPLANYPFTTDFARANAAEFGRGGIRSGIDAQCYAP